MSASANIAAIVLAAGRSSRMGSSKPALPLGDRPVLERVVQAISQAGVHDIVVVTGHDSQSLAPLLASLPARGVENPGYDAGMFSSVLAGAAALPAAVQCFFILPADYPLVGPQVLTTLLAAAAKTGKGIAHPTCCGHRGHPPLLSGRYRELLLQSALGDDLKTFLERHAPDTLEVEVEDLSILIDMDSEDDYRRVCRLAAATPSREDALYLHSLLQTPDLVLRHCQAVSAVGEALARALQVFVPSLDVELVSVGGLLHDLARTQRHHDVIGGKLLRSLGLARLASVLETHMVIPAALLAEAEVREEHLVYLADKLVRRDAVVGLEAREAHRLAALREEGAGAELLAEARARMDAARQIQEQVETVLGTSVKELLSGVGLWTA